MTATTDRWGAPVDAPDCERLSGMVAELAERARRIAPRISEFEASTERGLVRVLLTRWCRRHSSPGLPDPVRALADVAALVEDMVGGTERDDDDPRYDTDTAERILLALIERHPESEWIDHLDAALAEPLAAARIVDVHPGDDLVESLHSLRGITPVVGAGVVMTTDSWLYRSEVREVFPGASRIIEKAIDYRDSAYEPPAQRGRDRCAPLGMVNARGAVGIAVRVRDAKARRTV